MTQKDNQDNSVQLYLGLDYLGYSIAYLDPENSCDLGTCCFYVTDFSMGDGDGFPMSIAKDFVRIEEKDYLHVMNIFRQTEDAMCRIGEIAGKPLDRPIAKGDFLYSAGDYLHIIDIPEPSNEYWGAGFYIDQYDLDISRYTEYLTGSDGNYEKEELAEYMLISKEDYVQALKVGKSGILEAYGYLEELYFKLLLGK